MSIQPILTFKAGRCDLDTSTSPPKVKPHQVPGYIYLYTGEADELTHFCWRARSQPVSEPELDLLMIPGDGTFLPYTGSTPSSSSNNVKSPTNGRIFVLKFSSSSQRYLFWLQSKSQHSEGNPSWFSPRDLKLGQIVDMLLSGEELDIQDELRNIKSTGDDGDDGDGDETMEDVEESEGKDHRSNSTGNAGPDATGGDFREEGEPSREAGADGGRAASSSAPNDPSSVVQNFLRSLQSGPITQSRQASNPFTTLADLFSSNTTVPLISTFTSKQVDSLLSNLPPEILLLAQESADTIPSEVTPEAAQAAIEALTAVQKKDILERVLRSPQLHQSLGSLTMAIRDGGLPTVSEALHIRLQNDGYVKGSSMPLGGGEAVEAFLEGIKKQTEEENKKADA